MAPLRVIVTAMSLTLLFGGTIFGADLEPPDFKEPTNHCIIDTRAFILEPPPEVRVVPVAIAAALIPAVIDKGVDLLASAVRRASEEQEATATALASNYFYGVQENGELNAAFNGKRLVIVRGMFGHTDTQGEGKDPLWKQRASQIGLVGEPEFYYEGEFVAPIEAPKSNSETQPTTTDEISKVRGFKVESLFLEYNKFLVSGMNRERDVVISLAFKGPFMIENEKTDSFAVGILKFEGVRRGTRLEKEALKCHDTGWLALMPAPEKSDLVEGEMIPFNVDVTVTETRDANKFLGFVADVLDESKEDLKNTITIQVIGEQK